MADSANLQALKIDRGGGGRKRRRRSPWPLRLVLVAVFAGALWVFQRPLLQLVDRLRLPEVRVARALLRSPASAGAVSGAAANGYVVARVSAALSADTPGRLVELNVVEGSVVKEGQVVARLYYDEFQAAFDRAQADRELAEASYDRSGAERDAAGRMLESLRAQEEAAAAVVDEAQAELDFAEKDYPRVQRLLEQGALTESRLDEAQRALDGARARVATRERQQGSARAAALEGESRLEVAAVAVRESRARVDVARAALDQARATLDKTYVRAPFDGVVVQKEAEVGEVVSPNSQGGGSLTRGSIVTMVDLDSLEVQAEVPETTLPAVRLGGPARIFLDAYPGQPYRGRIDRIWPMADRQKATVEVRVAFEERDDKLRPEMGVRVVFLDQAEETPEQAQPAEPVVMIPDAAVVRVEGEDGAFVLERNVVRFQRLALGERGASRVVVDSGLAGSELVVLDPPTELRDGDRVRPKEER